MPGYRACTCAAEMEADDTCTGRAATHHTVFPGAALSGSRAARVGSQRVVFRQPERWLDSLTTALSAHEAARGERRPAAVLRSWCPGREQLADARSGTTGQGRR